jgi:hypothetical protein
MQLRRGQIIACHFLDHVQGGTSPLRFVAYGRLIHIARDTLTICGWENDPPAKETPANIVDTNRTLWVIMRSAITEIEQLRRA